ncbi:MAG: hypothetical protein AAGF12_14530 [Myxococcota bacterium]
MVHRVAVMLCLGVMACVGTTFGGCTGSAERIGSEDAAVSPQDAQGMTDVRLPDAQVADGSAQDGSTPTDAAPPVGQTLSERYPNDAWDTADPAILFATDFETDESGLALSSYTGDRAEVLQAADLSANGSGSLRLSFTLGRLRNGGTASAQANVRFPLPPTRTYYVRFYQRYGAGTARPHHGSGTRVHAEGADRGGTAGIRPDGNERFNTRIDLDGQDRQFFYTYWHEMRSGRCNDGSAVPGCAGDQGSTYYFGNRFRPADQRPVDRFEWACYEYQVRANRPNEYDGALLLWTDDELVGRFETGSPLGQWLRDNFYTMGEFGTEPTTPFEGFNFRSSDGVDQVRVTFEIYQEQRTLENNRDDTPNKAEQQAVFFDDIVIATERIGCRVDR